METPRSQSLSPNALGAIAGSLACIVFLIYHHITISNIWAMAPIMLLISALAGYSLSQSYHLLFGNYSPRTWVVYIMYFTLGLTLMSIVSVLIFTPRISSQVVLSGSGPIPGDIILSALPLTLGWLVILAVGITLIVNPSWKILPSVLGTSAVLFLTLGLNLSTLGMIEIDQQHQYLVEKFLLMNLGLGITFMLFYLIFERYLVTSPDL